MRYTITNTSLTHPLQATSQIFKVSLYGRASKTGGAVATIPLTIDGQANRHLVPDQPGSIILDIKGQIVTESAATDAVIRTIQGRMVARVSEIGTTSTNAINFVTQGTDGSAGLSLLNFGGNASATANTGTHTIADNTIALVTTAQTATTATYSFFPDIVAGTATSPAYIRFRTYAADNTTNPATFSAMFEIEGVQNVRGVGTQYTT